MTRTAVIAGQGGLSAAVVENLDDPLIYALEGYEPDFPAEPFRIERLVPFLDGLIEADVSRVVFAGAIRRPRLDPELFDPRTAQLVPRILMAMQSGDDAALRAVLDVFEEHGLTIWGIADAAPDLVPAEGLLVGTPSDADRRDAERGAELLAATGALDIGQGVVVAQGLCLALETLPGTEAMLDFSGRYASLRPDPNGAKGVFYKAPKANQDRRIDLPTIGPDTVSQVANAGLAGIAWLAGSVILLDRDECIRRASESGLFLWSRG
ncbi:UDP-2,3-diacylglucosamine diphosphatase LpxI [Paracoccus sp. 11-3]|uniref:UDP-2,3-diacylglucosamine diphosphatase LpxI n=1 Tax=Paracoccus amoyensis TaxID=2760093 RepID=A0A926G9V9_9RHOB|nr:UDP-2,3-diacylglucosamine diphosphatase LpxI [Paracoccus amoyensis]MBC9246006.1 UDP-2,3-diacylglucosamine diphosphatase LpxI [Paracoccus amoyensis]